MRVTDVGVFQSDKDLVYYTDSPNSMMYSFSGWKQGWLPTETFDAHDYIGCLHGVSLALMLVGDPKRSHAAIEDDGVIHELIHALHINGSDGGIRWFHDISIFTGQSTILNRRGRDIRVQLEQLQNDATGAYEQRLAERDRNKPNRQLNYYIYQTKPEDFKPFVSKAREKGFEEELQGERYFEIGTKTPQVLYTSKPVHQPVLQRSGQEETGDPTILIETKRPNDVRNGESGPVSVQQLQQAGTEVQSD